MEMLMSNIDPIQTARELATHASEIDHLQADMDNMVEEMKQIKISLEAIQKTLAEAHGGWRTLMYVGGAASAAGGAVAWVLEKLLK
jgi:prefoldin subunit 5